MQKNNDGYQEAVIVKIGIFDSGIGGLSLLHQAMITLPEVDYVFYADVDNVPYGEKTNEQIREYVDKAVGFLVEKGCSCACLQYCYKCGDYISA